MGRISKLELLRLTFLLGAALAGGLYLDDDALKGVASIIAGFAGLAISALVPTMIWSATSLHTNFKGLVEFNKYRQAISKQLSFLGGLFFSIILLGVVLILGGLFGWKDVTTSVGPQASHWFTIHWMAFINGATVFFLLQVGLKFVALVSAIRSLFNFHADAMEKQIKDQIKEKHDLIARSDKLPMDPRREFGETLGTLGEHNKPH
ncbi:hypothetical protein PUV47_01765 [Pseudovibrio exalbescens]|uniref:hypothetical protein n=1 Tax=Pseudovibrio exalbescens TaxID=197461 RepID=UPI0023663E19|nr:hypothetical protein [Pseudovibrio exalbescens]MDD7908630.1 hypothetical protein [Pseudovibrio exalbescens]